MLETPQAEIAYSYNDAGQLVSMNHDGVGVTEYEYDDDGRLVSLTNPFDETTTFVYDDASRLTRKNLANGVYELYTYDNRSRLIGIQIKNSAHSLIDSHEYEYDAVSNIVERTSGGVTTEFGYDLVGQLISETRSGYSASYTYDANGNRLTRTVNSVTEEYTYDGADKLLEVSINAQTVKEFTYDSAGRTTAITTSAGTTTLSWDYEDRLTGITYPSTATNSFSYNAFGARVSKTDSSGTSTYTRNGVSVVAPVLSDGSLTYTPGISSREGSNSTWSHGDIKNSLRQTGESETTSATKHYDAFGNETTATGTWHGPFQYGGNFGYQTDPDSNLKLLGHRYHNPSTGRFISRDTIKDGRNWYSYCDNNPTGFADPAGLQKVVVRGDDEGVPYSGIGYWWTKPSIDKKRGDIELIEPSRDTLMNALEDADTFFFWGHGANDGRLYLGNGEYLTVDDLRELARRRAERGKPKMNSAELRSCWSCGTSEVVNAWLDVAKQVTGFPGVTGDSDGFPPKIYTPRTYKDKINYDPRDTAPGKKKKNKKGKA